MIAPRAGQRPYLRKDLRGTALIPDLPEESQALFQEIRRPCTVALGDQHYSRAAESPRLAAHIAFLAE